MMIKENILNNINYENLKLNIAIKWLKSNKNSDLEIGIHEIDGKDIFAIVQEYATQSEEKLKWEGHRKYIDIQYIFNGIEEIAVSKIKNMKEIIEYNEEGDYQFFEGEGNKEKLNKGDYLILYPEDIHKPCIGNGNKVKKIVIKVKL